jgi:hypothetical protein
MSDPAEQIKCPLATRYGDIICIDGQLWALTYSEMAPPDSRQTWGECQWCKKNRTKAAE